MNITLNLILDGLFFLLSENLHLMVWLVVFIHFARKRRYFSMFQDSFVILKYVPYHKIGKSLGFKSVKEMQDFIIYSIYAKIIRAPFDH
jgi:hypothetical protein